MTKNLKTILQSWEDKSLAPISKSKKNLPAILSSAFSISAGAMLIYSGDKLGENPIVSAAKAEALTTLAYNTFHPILFAFYNRERYFYDGILKGSKAIIYDMLFKLAPSGGISNALITHIGRPTLQSVFASYGADPTASFLGISGTLDIITLYTRNKILELGGYAKKKIEKIKFQKELPRNP